MRHPDDREDPVSGSCELRTCWSFKSRPALAAAMKQTFYILLVEKLDARSGMPKDVLVTFVDEYGLGLSFGLGRAQFLTCELT